MSRNAGLPDNKRITNTSVRKTLVQRMTGSNDPDALQVCVTCNKNIQSMNNYRTKNDTQKYAISIILSDPHVKLLHWFHFQTLCKIPLNSTHHQRPRPRLQ